MPSSSTSTGTAVSSSIPTIGGVDITDAIRLAIGDTDASAYEYTNAQLAILLGDAVKVYQRLRPYRLERTITVVDGQGDYALPSDFVSAIHIPYRSFPSVTTDDTLLIGLFNLSGFSSIIPYADWSDSVLMSIANQYRSTFEQLGAGQSEVTTYLTSYAATQYLRLYPTPTADGSFALRYNANHPIQNGDYFTIPSYHSIYIQKLLQAEVFDVRDSGGMSGVSEFAAGTTRIKVGSGGKGQSLGSKAANLRQEVFDALSRPVGRVG